MKHLFRLSPLSAIVSLLFVSWFDLCFFVCIRVFPPLIPVCIMFFSICIVYCLDVLCRDLCVLTRKPGLHMKYGWCCNCCWLFLATVMGFWFCNVCSCTGIVVLTSAFNEIEAAILEGLFCLISAF